MQTIEAKKLFNNRFCIDDISIDSTDEIFIDFSNVTALELRDITTLLDIQKVAILNKKKIKIENVKPEVSQILEITGLYKTFANLMTNPILVSKRISI
ncbi:MAG: hypothetical protein PHV37_10110 [Candidatus Gastranaerophilales bacterium]|nr:hypothetical protein [Candidatus Gastranaerophilales bacterium]